jgi:hypothetical protein
MFAAEDAAVRDGDVAICHFDGSRDFNVQSSGGLAA